ncbi:GTPase-activating protein [Plasmodium gonderi]|uniref:GTPase-activating protein n=1 Tax=Plasmodium gonderi TaxID=77519 RepID=A0A1Y1JRS1_PLAGO|nr:GTPase-activating protein [Plasmodium gonderi]GAW83163.1 GTPase-activating protein [Plasmodium gonderi]
MHLKEEGGSKAYVVVKREETIKQKKEISLSPKNEVMVKSKDDLGSSSHSRSPSSSSSSSVYDDTIEKNINFSESIMANLNDNIFDHKNIFTDSQLREGLCTSHEEIQDIKKIDFHTTSGRIRSDSSSVNVQGKKVVSSGDEFGSDNGLAESRKEIMSHSTKENHETWHPELATWGEKRPSKWGALRKWEISPKMENSIEGETSLHSPTRRKREVLDEERVDGEKELSKCTNITGERNEKEIFPFSIKVNKTNWRENEKKIPENAYEYSHNVIYHELYVELLQVNKGLQNEIKNLKKIIEMQKLLIKSREDLFGSSHMNDKNKISGKKFVNNNYFLNFFNKKKKKKSQEDFLDIPTGERIGRASTETSSYATVTKDEEIENNEKRVVSSTKGMEGYICTKNSNYTYKNKKNPYLKWEVMNNSDGVGHSEVEMNTICNNERMYESKNEYVKLPLSDNEDSDLSEREDNTYSIDNNVDNSGRNASSNNDRHNGKHNDRHNGRHNDRHNGRHNDRHNGRHNDRHNGRHNGRHNDRHNDRHNCNNHNNSTEAVCATEGSHYMKRENSDIDSGSNERNLFSNMSRGDNVIYEKGGKVENEKECNEKSVNFEEITAITLWYEDIIPLINNEKKKKTLIDLMISNYMPYVIKTYFWEMNIINKLNITDYFVQILIKNTNFIQSYVYTNNKQYHNHVSRYFKSLITLRNGNLGVIESVRATPYDETMKNGDPSCSRVKGNNEINEKKEIITHDNDSFSNTKNESAGMNQEVGKEDKQQKEKYMMEQLKGKNENKDEEEGDIKEDIKENIKEEEKNTQREVQNNIQRNDEDSSNAGLNLFQRFSFQKFFYQILIDLDRTLYIIKKNQEYFKKYNISTDTFLLNLDMAETKTKLNTLLQMYVVFKPELGYVQGMSYIALVFLLYCNLEKAFVHFANFMERKDIYNLYSFNNSEIKVYTYIIKEILTKQNIEIYKEIVKQYNIDNIFIQWIYTIFLTCLPFHIFIRLFDIYLFNEKIIYETILCIFSYFNKFHHVENVDIVIKNLSAFSFNTHIQEDKFWSLLKKSKIKKRKIHYYREKYFKVHRDNLNEK